MYWPSFTPQIITNKQIVPHDSSSLEGSRQQSITINADHMGMVKFSGKDDQGYEMVKGDIEDLYDKAQQNERIRIDGMIE